MFETNEAAHGAGLAANQIGDDRRMFIYDCPDQRHPTTRLRHQPDDRDLADPDQHARPRRRLRGLPVRPRGELPHRPGRLGARSTGFDSDRRADRGGGHRLLRPLPAARGRPPGRVPVPRPADRQERRSGPSRPSASTVGACPGCPGCPAPTPTRSVTDTRRPGLEARPSGRRRPPGSSVARRFRRRPPVLEWRPRKLGRRVGADHPAPPSPGGTGAAPVLDGGLASSAD